MPALIRPLVRELPYAAGGALQCQSETPSIQASLHPTRKQWINGWHIHRITEMAAMPRVGEGASQFQGLDWCSLCETETVAGHSLSMTDTKGKLTL